MKIENKNIIDMQLLYRDEKYMPLLHMLEEPFGDVQATYPGITKADFQNLVNYALEWEKPDYWPLKAITWLENGLALSDEIVERLVMLSRNDALPQTVKARIDKLLDESMLCEPA